MSADIRQNPFQDRGKWYWRGVSQHINGPYNTQVEALKALLRHCDPGSRWARLWAAWLEFLHA